MSSPTPSLTQHLLSLDPAALHAATTHPFLAAAATNALPARTTQSWLAQDRLYALSYTTFAATLLAKVRIPSTSGRASTPAWRTAAVLIDCLANIAREVALFEDVAAARGWSALLDETRPNAATRAYHGVFAAAAQPAAPLLVGLVTLWGTEACYLRAWEGAATLLAGEAAEEDIMAKVFIPNWSSEEFRAFVKVLADLVDELGKDVGEEERRECEDAWRVVLEVEKEFWPEV